MWAAAPAELASRTLPPAATTDPTRRRVVRLAATASGSSRPALLLTAQCPPAAPAGAPGGPTAFASWSQGQGTEMRCSVSRHIPARVTGHCQGARDRTRWSQAGWVWEGAAMQTGEQGWPHSEKQEQEQQQQHQAGGRGEAGRADAGRQGHSGASSVPPISPQCLILQLRA